MGKLNFNSMKFEKFLRVTLGFVGTNIFLTPLWGSLIAGMIFENQRNQRSNIDNEKFEKYKEYFNRTEYGDLLRFETSKNRYTGEKFCGGKRAGRSQHSEFREEQKLGSFGFVCL